MRLLAISVLFFHFSFCVAADGKVERLAEFNWKMNCQGCHQANGAGSAGGAPDMRGVVAKFLSVDGGREYLSQVPGVSYAPLNNKQLAELVNWLLVEYDKENLPSDFKAFSEAEIGSLRKNPLVENAPVMRTKLLAQIKEIEGRNN